MGVRWLDEISSEEITRFGGKAASLGQLTALDAPVPQGFVVTTDSYRTVLREAGIEEELADILDVDPDEEAAIGEAAHRARSLIRTASIPTSVRSDIVESYEQLGEDVPVAVRSSATAEDRPDASFAGQQETFLNVTGEDLLDRVKACWASLFTERAILYRQEHGYSHDDVAIAVIVQEMIDAEKSGVLFTSPPSEPGETMVVEAVWGLGEAAVSGTVTPDNYVVDRESRSVVETTVTGQEKMLTRDPETGDTVERPVPSDSPTQGVLDETEIERLSEIALEIEAEQGEPQDIEWAMVDGDAYLLQSRPITTHGDEEEDILATGLGTSPGRGSGPARHVDGDDFEAVGAGDVIVTSMTTPDMMPALRRAAGIVTDEGGETCHAAIVSRELGVPAVVGARDATDGIEPDQVVTVDGDTGSVRAGDLAPDEEESDETAGRARVEAGVAGGGPVTATPVLTNVSIPEAAERAAETGADGVGLLRLEHTVLSLGATPEQYAAEHGRDALVERLAEEIRTVVDAFYPDPVRVRTLDAPTDEFRSLDGGEDEPEEANPMLGYRGIRRSLDRPDPFRQQLRAVARLREAGYDNLEVMFPLVTDAEDVQRAREEMREVGLDPEVTTWGTMIETPASALSIEEIVDAGVEFVSFGTNDLTQYTLAVDRNNEWIADRYDALHPAVRRLIERVIEVCDDSGVKTSICGEAGSDPEMIETLVDAGIDSLSVNVDAVGSTRRRVARAERQRLLDVARD